MESKLPRAVLGVLVGVAFGVGGAIFQTTLRNPLASPDIIGVSIGASAAAVFAIVALDQRGGWPVSVAAVVGALGVALVVRARRRRPRPATAWCWSASASRAALLSVIQYLFTRADVYDAQLVLRWLTGSVSGADWPTIRLLAGSLLVSAAGHRVWLARSLRVDRARRRRRRRARRHRAAYGRLLLLVGRPARRRRGRGGRARSRSSRSWPGRSPGRSTAAGPRCSAPAWSAR